MANDLNDDDLLKTHSSPSKAHRVGVRRLNGRPLIVVGVLVAGFLAVMAKTAMDRSDEQKLRDRSNEAKGGDSSMFASSLASMAPKAFVPPDAGGPPVVPITKDSLDFPPPPPVTATGGGPTAPPVDQEKDKIRQMKMAAMLNAVRAPINARAGNSSGNDFAGQTNGRTAGGDQQEKLREAMTRLANGPVAPGAQSASSGGPGRFGPPGSSNREALLQLAMNSGMNPSMGGDSDTASDPASRANFDQWDNSTPGKERWALRAKLQDPRSRFEIRAGAVIPAVMVTGINSDLAGPIIAQVSQNVYDTPTGRELLIPQGTKLFGRYSNEISYGQSRVLIGWQRLTWPDGRTIDIGSMPGADEAGYAGFADQVNNHYWRLFGNALFLTAITGGVALSQRDSNTGIGGTRSASDVMSQQLGIVLGQTIVQMIRKNMNLSPTIEIRPGYRFNVITTKDITLDRDYQLFDYKQGGLN